MKETVSPPGPYDQLTQVTTVIVLFQAVFLLAQLSTMPRTRMQ